jgi:ABC-2 type transport system permease protein
VTIALTTTERRGHAGLTHTIRAEWTKLMSLRSTKWTLAVAALGTLLVTYLGTRSSLHRPPAWYGGFDPTNQSLAGLFVASLAVGVLGALAVTGEYSTGTIRSSLAAMPRRDVLLAAKVIVVGAVTLVVGEVLAFAAFFEGQAILSTGAPTASLTQPGVLRAVVLSGAFLALLALFALGIGTAVRHTAGAIAGFAGLTVLTVLILERISQRAGEFAPDQIFANSVAAVVPQGHELSATIGFLMMCVYTVIALGVGAAVLLRRDA